MSAFSIDEKYIPVDTISGEFILRNEYETRFSGVENFSIISSTMATSCSEKFTNKLETQSIKITCDQDFVFDGNTISANADFSNLEDIKIDAQQFGSNTLELHFQQSLDFIPKYFVKHGNEDFFDNRGKQFIHSLSYG